MPFIIFSPIRTVWSHLHFDIRADRSPHKIMKIRKDGWSLQFGEIGVPLIEPSFIHSFRVVCRSLPPPNSTHYPLTYRNT